MEDGRWPPDPFSNWSWSARVVLWLVIAGCLRHVPALPDTPWEILVCAVMLVLIVKGLHIVSVKLLDTKNSTHHEVFVENIVTILNQ